MNYFIYKGINSNTFNSLVVQELPAITKPPIKYQTTTIDGRDGDITETLGYKAYDKEITIGLKDMSELDDIIEWLTGNGELTLSNEPDKYYNAQILNQINFDNDIVITNERHKNLITKAIENLDKAQATIKEGMPVDILEISLKDVLINLGSITGEEAGEEIIKEIFSRFCLGK